MNKIPSQAHADSRFKTVQNPYQSTIGTNIKLFKKGEIILLTTPTTNFSGLINKGLVYLIGENESSERGIIDYFEKGDLLYQQAPLTLPDNTFFLLAKTECAINLVNLQSFPQFPSNSEHNLMNLLRKFEKKSSTHLYILQQRTLRRKLLLYFTYLKQLTGTNIFTVPLCYTDLADYLSADRSSLMRALQKLNSEGLLKSHKRTIELFDPSK
ncbi:MAG TPA: Crp/Fnr family transcriptional regulator [Candidatus Avacidaminococcus intestinavium]|uniref:Crp/Fnr family transcriptional regulator n=1 Tax=Candidatus Avacidaminococcus intestinavium TaxID=2840684 RepID=A0A9D1SL90_9FIRM|nr:Crp/Fnr family transcriptional regulator [Candidatus Avacidaminococcus intestinavium]